MRGARTLPALGLAVLLLLLLASPSSAATPFRMVGKGSIAGTLGGVASYAYIVNCDSSANTHAPFEVRFGSQVFRLTGTSAVDCTDDPAVDNPERSFDTQTGLGVGTLTSGGPGTIDWEFVDGGLGGTSDSSRITIRDSGGTIVFQGTSAPPGHFPGSDQATGNNTAYPESQPGLRMVGKGAIPGTVGGTAAYAYILRCDAAANAGAPFEVRFGAQVFRLTGTSLVACSDDPAVLTPPAGFDTQTGSGSGTFTTGGPGTVAWKFVDGGLGGTLDSAEITVRDSGGTVIFQGTAAPPGPFPGSDQPTGNNTAQSVGGGSTAARPAVPVRPAAAPARARTAPRSKARRACRAKRARSGRKIRRTARTRCAAVKVRRARSSVPG